MSNLYQDNALAPYKAEMYYRQVGTSPLECWYGAAANNDRALTTRTSAANTMYAYPFFSTRGGTLDRIAMRVSTGGGAGVNARLGIYQATSDTNLYPNTLILDAGEIDVSSTGVKAITISQALTKDTLYWFVFAQESGTQPVYAAFSTGGDSCVLGLDSGLATPSNGIGVAYTYAALPNPFTAGGTVQTSNPFLIACRFSA